MFEFFKAPLGKKPKALLPSDAIKLQRIETSLQSTKQTLGELFQSYDGLIALHKRHAQMLTEVIKKKDREIADLKAYVKKLNGTDRTLA